MVIFLAQFLAAIWISVPQLTDSGNSAASFVFEPATIEAGEVACGTIWRGTIKLTNAGTVKGTVSDLSTSCGCTATDIKQGDNIGPGETRDVAVSLHVGKRQGGHQKVTILCEYESGQANRGLATASITATARCDEHSKGIELTPPAPAPLIGERSDQ